MASERVMRVFRLCALIMLTVLYKNVFATFETAGGYSVDNLYSTAGNAAVIGGLELDGNKLYFGEAAEVKSLDLTDGSVISIGTLSSDKGVSVVVRRDDLTYAAFTTSFNSPYPYKMGYLDAGGTYTHQLDEDGIYDAAVNSQGQLYISANPDALGSKIFRYDWQSGFITEIADIGGATGGLAFDSQDNLYYADQGIYGERSASVLRFTAAQVAAGGLDVVEAESVFDIAAGYIDFDSFGDLYACTGWGTTLARYDLDSGAKIEDIAYATNNEYMWKFTLGGDYLYTYSTEYSNYFSTIRQITVPEPTTVILLGLAGIWLRSRRV